MNYRNIWAYISLQQYHCQQQIWFLVSVLHVPCLVQTARAHEEEDMLRQAERMKLIATKPQVGHPKQ